jgi:hypothetical protein
MAGVRAWQLVQMVAVVQLFVVEDPSSSHHPWRPTTRGRAGKVTIFNGEEAPMDTGGVHLETLKETGETNRNPSLRSKINSSLKWVTLVKASNNKGGSNRGIATALR